MKQFLRKYGKWLFFGLIILIALIAYTNYGLYKLFNIGCTPDPFPAEVIIDDWTDTLEAVGYEPAVIVEDATIPEDLPETVEGVIYAEGEHQGSEVVLTIVETPDGNLWVKETIDSDEVKFDKIEYVPMQKPVQDNDWSLIIEGAYLNGVDFGAGIAYEPFTIAGARIGLQSTVDVNPTITDRPDWVAVSGRVSRRFGAVSLGGCVGYRFGQEQGLHCGVVLGVVIGL